MQVSELATWSLDDSDLVGSGVVPGHSIVSVKGAQVKKCSVIAFILRCSRSRRLGDIRVASPVLKALIDHFDGVDEEHWVVRSPIVMGAVVVIRIWDFWQESAAAMPRSRIGLGVPA